MEHIEQSDEMQWASKSRAMLDVWLAQIVSTLHSYSDGKENVWVPNTGGRLLLTGNGCERQRPHNDFPVDKNKDATSGYFVMVSGNDPFPIWVADYSHNQVYGNANQLHRNAQNMILRGILVPPNSVFIGHGYLTHAGAGDADRVVAHKTMRYHMYLRPQSVRIPDAVSFAFGHDKITFGDHEYEPLA